MGAAPPQNLETRAASRSVQAETASPVETCQDMTRLRYSEGDSNMVNIPSGYLT